MADEREYPDPDELTIRAILNPEEFSDGEPEDGPAPESLDEARQHAEPDGTLKFRRGEVL